MILSARWWTTVRNLLGARIAADGQWRFPHSDRVPENFRDALLTFEDRYFYYHPGFNPVSMIRALGRTSAKGVP
jgi:penicillin-binding protein 1C